MIDEDTKWRISGFTRSRGSLPPISFTCRSFFFFFFFFYFILSWLELENKKKVNEVGIRGATDMRYLAEEERDRGSPAREMKSLTDRICSSSSSKTHTTWWWDDAFFLLISFHVIHTLHFNPSFSSLDSERISFNHFFTHSISYFLLYSDSWKRPGQNLQQYQRNWRRSHSAGKCLG